MYRLDESVSVAWSTKPQAAALHVDMPDLIRAAFLSRSTLCLKGRRQRDLGRPFFVIFTDIDNTLRCKSGDRDRVTWELVALAEGKDIPLVAVTGLTADRVFARIDKEELPYFDGIASSVGTEARLLQQGSCTIDGYVLDEDYRAELEALWPDYSSAYQSVIESFEQVSKRIEHSGLHEPENADFEPFRISGHFFAHRSREGGYRRRSGMN